MKKTRESIVNALAVTGWIFIIVAVLYGFVEEKKAPELISGRVIFLFDFGIRTTKTN